MDVQPSAGGVFGAFLIGFGLGALNYLRQARGLDRMFENREDR